MDDVQPQPSRPGNVYCLKCGRPWESPDRRRVRICNKCKRDQGRYGAMAEKACVSHVTPPSDTEL